MLRETKRYFEQLFSDEWVNTPIHFAGQEFNAQGVEQWINPTLQPLRNTATGISGSTMYTFLVYVVCWAETDADCMDLADSVAGFMAENVDNAYSSIGYDIIDQGWQDSNSVFAIMSFEYKTYGGICFEVTSCSQSVGGEDGTEFNLDGFWLPSCTIFKG